MENFKPHIIPFDLNKLITKGGYKKGELIVCTISDPVTIKTLPIISKHF